MRKPRRIQTTQYRGWSQIEGRVSAAIEFSHAASHASGLDELGLPVKHTAYRNRRSEHLGRNATLAFISVQITTMHDVRFQTDCEVKWTEGTWRSCRLRLKVQTGVHAGATRSFTLHRDCHDHVLCRQLDLEETDRIFRFIDQGSNGQSTPRRATSISR